MTKSELIEKLAKDLSMPGNIASPIIDKILDPMIEVLINGENVEIRGF